MSAELARGDGADDDPLVTRLRQLREALPEGGRVTLSRADLGQLLEEADSEGTRRPGEPLIDLTVREVADRLDRAESTVRGWCADGEIPEAYKLRGREWRIPREAVRRFLSREADGEAEGQSAHGGSSQTSLSDWKEHR